MELVSLRLTLACTVFSVVFPTTTAVSDYSFCGTFCPANCLTTPTTPNVTVSPPRPTVRPEAPGNCKRVVCYYLNTDKLQYKGSGYLGKEDIDPSYCSHLIFSHAAVKGNKIVPGDDDDESSPGKKGDYEKVVELKKINPKLKIILQVGLSEPQTIDIAAMIKDMDKRRAFIHNTLTFLRRIGFDGILLSSSFVGQDHASFTQNKRHFTFLCQELRRKFDYEADFTSSPKLLMTAEFLPLEWYRKHVYDIRALTDFLDFIVLPLYGFHGYKDKVTKHPSPLYEGSVEKDQSELNVDTMVKLWLEAGVFKHKLVVGVDFTSRTFKLDSTKNSNVLAPTHGEPNPGPFSRKTGYLAYYEMCQLIDGGAERRYISSQKVPYLVSGDNWIGYEDEKSVKLKVKYIKASSLGGVSVSDINFDDFTGAFCKAGKYPLLKAIIKECSQP